MPAILGVNFGREFIGGPETLEKQGQQICRKKLLENFAEKFASKFPKIRRTKLKMSPQIRSAEPRDQGFSENYFRNC